MSKLRDLIVEAITKSSAYKKEVPVAAYISVENFHTLYIEMRDDSSMRKFDALGYDSGGPWVRINEVKIRSHSYLFNSCIALEYKNLHRSNNNVLC